MCGIAGYFSPNNFFGDSIDLITESLTHRGPDARGTFKEGCVALGHRRLSVLDLSPLANQPMVSQNGQFVMVYNGEVYNYRELAADLKYQSPQITFNTSSDTETILELYAQKGTQSLQRLNGMFAIAIYDKLKEDLILIRDRIGVKPIYYYWDGKNLAFASELKALTKLPGIKKEIDNEAILNYLHYGFIPAPLSIYKNIYKLEPGSCLRINKTDFKIFKYWNIESNLKEDVISNEKQALVVLSDLLSSSVQFQLRSDVPFGVFLSGGIDSSLVAALAVRFSGTVINTFSIGFEENRFDESRYATRVAKYLNTNHHQFIVRFNDAINLIEELPSVYDEPFADSSAIPTLLVSKLAREHVTVTLSGEGGDELFMGYGSYVWANRLHKNYFKLAKPFLKLTFSQMQSRYKRIAKLLDFENFSYSHLFSQEQYLFALPEIERLFINQDSVKDFKKNLYLRNERINFLKTIGKRDLLTAELQSIFDLELYLPDDLLTKIDRASMRYGLETRVPYLDHRIIEFALNLSPKLKIRNGVQKYILKEVLYQYIPKDFFNRPKQGFAIPLSKWIKNDLKNLIGKYLSEDNINQQGLFKYAEIKSLLKEYQNGNDFLYNRIWQLLAFQIWYEKIFKTN